MSTIQTISPNLYRRIIAAAANTRAGREPGFENGVSTHPHIMTQMLLGINPTITERRQQQHQYETAIRNVSNALRYSMEVQNGQHGRGIVGQQYLNERQNQMIRLLNELNKNYPGPALTVNRIMELTGMTKSNATYYIAPISAARQRSKTRSLNAAKNRVRRNP